ncbi:MAG: acyl-CoA dehydrogenase family protein [Acidimicrobiales bacterium]
MFTRSADQQLFEETTHRFLESECPHAKVRELAGTKAGYEPDYWRQGAQLGWTSLVVPEEAGGGSISARGVMDLALVAYQFGWHAAPGPLLGSNVVAAALGRWGSPEQQGGPLVELLRGEAVGAWALAQDAARLGPDPIGLRATETAGGYHLAGSASPVEAGGEADYVLVTARDGPGLSQFLVPADAPGVHRVPLHGLDLTRRFARIELETRVPRTSLVGEAGAAGPAVAWLSDLAVTVLLAEMCGAMRWAFDATVEWAFDRYSFGRPLASYQEIKHRFADMKMWLEASLAITARAADAVDRDTPDRAEVVSAGKFYVGRNGVELLQDCVQLHGGIGVTFDHDLHLFLRRVVTDAPLFGTPGEHAVRLTDILDAREAVR